MSKERRVVVVDRPSWYEPVIERQELARADTEVVVGWAHQADRPPEADRGFPFRDLSREALSVITADLVPPSVTTEARVIKMAAGCAGILAVRANIGAGVMDALPDLRVVGRYGIGVDNIDVEAATARGIAVVNAPGFCAPEVADHTLMCLLACTRKLLALDSSMRQGVWARDKASPMPAVHSLVLGLVGFGQIGREVARRAAPVGMRVIVCDPDVQAEEAQKAGVKLVELDELLAQADVVSLHAPLTSGTRHLLSRERVRRMKRSAYVINTSRGPLIDEAALAEALEQGWIAGAALDVFETEPLPESSPLRRLDNVLLTPHVAGLSDESQERARRTVARAVADVLLGSWPEGRELYNAEIKAMTTGRMALAQAQSVGDD
jgi:D-3-phosphoglycerate dehydrogenase